MILRKAPPEYKPGDKKIIVKFAFKPVQLRRVVGFDPVAFEARPEILGEVVWLERYVETHICYFSGSKINWQFEKSERYNTAFLNKLCE